jgi:hypothetical protein
MSVTEGVTSTYNTVLRFFDPQRIFGLFGVCSGIWVMRTRTARVNGPCGRKAAFSADAFSGNVGDAIADLEEGGQLMDCLGCEWIGGTGPAGPAAAKRNAADDLHRYCQLEADPCKLRG